MARPMYGEAKRRTVVEMKIGIVGKYVDGVEEIFRESFKDRFDVLVHYDQTDIPAFDDVDILILKGSGFGSAEDLEKMKNLKYLQKWGSGLNTIDLEAAGRLGIQVANVPGGNAKSVAELVVLHILILYRNVIPQSKAEQEARWIRENYMSASKNLINKVVGLIGGGHVGRNVAKLVQCFGASVQYYDPFRLPEEVEKEYGMKYVDFDKLIETSDVVSLHVPLLDSTKNMISREVIARMKPGALLINTARGGLVDEDALVEAVNSGKLGGAGLDCISKEPITPDSPLLGNNKILLTPHIGGCSGDLAQQMAPMIVKDVIDFADGKFVKAVANRKFIK